MKKLVLLSLSALLLSAVAITKYSNNSTKNANSLALADIQALSQGEDPGKVRKNCGLFSKSGCKADNYGATCATDADCN